MSGPPGDGPVSGRSGAPPADGFVSGRSGAPPADGFVSGRSGAPPADRYARQMLLADIGEEGQLRLQLGTWPVAGHGLAHEIAAAYAVRAGALRLVSGAIDTSELAPPFVQDPAARAVLAGS